MDTTTAQRAPAIPLKHRIATKISAFNRRRKWATFQREIAPTEEMAVLDIGFNATEYSHVDNFIEKHYPYLHRLTALGMEDPTEFQKKYPAVKAIQYGGDVFPFPNNSFDVCWSNAVIEHVGSWDRQVHFLQELRRVGRRSFITTPNRFFPVEVHTRTPLLHWLPKPVFDRYLHLRGHEWAAGDYMHLLSLSQVKKLLKAAGITDYRIHKNWLGPFVVDFVIVF